MADDLRYFRPRNWAKFQHYKDRRPPWIKLHRSLLTDHDFHRLTIPQQRHLMFLWLLYAETAAPLPLDNRWLARNLQVDYRTIAGLMSTLLSNDFIELCDKSASTALASRKQDASPETEAESERETESNGEGGSGGERPQPPSAAPRASSRKHTRCPEHDLPDEWIEAGNRRRAKAGLPELTPAQMRHRYQEFQTYWQSTNKTKVDWKATWCNNCVDPRTEQRFRPNEVTGQRNPVSNRFGV